MKGDKNIYNLFMGIFRLKKNDIYWKLIGLKVVFFSKYIQTF